MSNSNRDHRGRQPSGKHCPESANGGCVYCRTGSYKRADRRTRRAGARAAIREQLH